MTTMSVIPFQNIINDALKEQREIKEQKSWYASSLGSCLRGQYIQRLGIIQKEFTDRELRIFKVGNVFEEWVISLLQKNPEIKIETQTRLEIQELDAVGKPDLIVEYQGAKKIYEIKTKHSRAFWYMQKEGKPMRQHQQQLWFYLKATGIESGSIVYLSKDDLMIAEYPVRLDDEGLADSVISELKALQGAWKVKDIELLPLPSKDDWRAKYCNFHEYCLNPEKLKNIIKNNK